MTGDSEQNNQCGPRRLITLKEAAEMLCISSRTMYRLMAAGCLPSPVKVGRATRLVLTEVDAYIDQLKAKRRQVGGALPL